jgi:phospholipid/cholesterol/gamma-HCH transport system substrate-binding protein
MTPSKSVEVKVGIFVVICLATVAGLILRFGNIRPINTGTYNINVTFSNAAGLVKDTSVMYSGIPVGHVTEIKLDDQRPGNVNVRLAIHQGVTIREDAKFMITQTGLLGDRMIEVTPRTLTARALEDGDTVTGEKSADFNELVGVIKNVLLNASTTIERIDHAVARLDETILSRESLGHVTNSLANVDAATSNVVVFTAELNGLTTESRAQIKTALADLAKATEGFKETSTHADALLKRGHQVVTRADDILADNQDDVRRAAQNMAESTERLNSILARLEKGEGTAGKLLTDQDLYLELRQITEIVKRYGLFFNTWFGRKVPADKFPAPSAPAASNSVQAAPDNSGR